MKFFLDSASVQPSFAFIDNNKIIHEYSLSHILDHRGYQEIAKFSNYIFDKIGEYNLSLKDIREFAFVSGPGSFSGLRFAFILGKLLFREIPDIQIYSINMFDLYKSVLLSLSACAQDDNNNFAYKSGLTGYMTQDSIINTEDFMKNYQDKYTVLDIHDNKFSNLAINGLNYLIHNNTCLKLINNLEEFCPNYIKQPGITTSQKKK